MSPRLVHCSYHKCLTVYYSAVMNWLFNRCLFFGRGYRHFNSMVDDFYRTGARFRVASVNNHLLDVAALGDCRISRFVRDPRDLIVSGYFYHKRGAEPWCHVVDPRDEDWRVVNGTLPEQLGPGQSYTTFLNSVDLETGLIAEIQFRTRHFESMAAWPADGPQIRTLRYEDILGHEVESYRALFEFYGLAWHERQLGLWLARKFASSESRGQSAHVRNPEPSQWKKHFTPRVLEYFMSRHEGLLARYRYEP